MNARALLAGPAFAIALCAAPALQAQPPGVQRQVLQRAAGPAQGQEVLLVRVEIAAGGSAGRHSHPGIETGYVVDGEVTMEIDGEAPRRLVAGDSYFIPAGRVHDARATGGRPATALATFVVERGKALAVPAAP